MATTTTRFKTSHNHFPKKAQTQQTQTAIAKPKRRRCRETTISSAAEDDDPGDEFSGRTSVVKNLTSSPLPLPPPPRHRSAPNPNPTANSVNSPSPSSSPSTFRIRFSPGSLSPVMDFTAVNGNGNHHHETTSSSSTFPTSFTKFNSVLTAGLLNPMSPPPPMCDKTRSSPTLFEMMASEPDVHPPRTSQIQHRNHNPNPNPNLNFAVQDKNAMAMQRISDALSSRSPGSLFNDASSGDIKLTLTSMDGITVSMSVHRQILSANSRFFAVKLSDRWAKQQNSPPYVVEIADCEDVEVYIEALRLMYCKDLRKKLMKEDVPRVLGILKVSAAIGFDAGVLSCLEYLEAAPWAEEEEEKVASLLSELRLEGFGAGEVLKRVSADSSAGAENNSTNINNNEEVLLKLLNVVLEGKDEKARREMKLLVLKMLRENNNNANGDPIRKESLYRACESCLSSLRHHFLRAAESSPENDDLAQIARQSDNLHWLLDIMIDRHLAADFVASWASEAELARAHRKIPAVHRFEVSRVTARMFVGIGKGQVLAPKEVRGKLLGTWLGPFYEDFGWMRRASRGLDRHLIEDGLSNTILTLPLPLQQEILLAWFNRFLNSGEDCPNIQRGFEVWWRRSFWRGGVEPPENTPSLRIMAATIEN